MKKKKILLSIMAVCVTCAIVIASLIAINNNKIKAVDIELEKSDYSFNYDTGIRKISNLKTIAPVVDVSEENATCIYHWANEPDKYDIYSTMISCDYETVSDGIEPSFTIKGNELYDIQGVSVYQKRDEKRYYYKAYYTVTFAIEKDSKKEAVLCVDDKELFNVAKSKIKGSNIKENVSEEKVFKFNDKQGASYYGLALASNKNLTVQEPNASSPYKSTSGIFTLIYITDLGGDKKDYENAFLKAKDFELNISTKLATTVTEMKDGMNIMLATESDGMIFDEITKMSGFKNFYYTISSSDNNVETLKEIISHGINININGSETNIKELNIN